MRLLLLTFLTFLTFLTMSWCRASPERAGKQPVSAIVFFRHGDRTPVDPYPLDPYRDPKYWPVPWGELTDIGKKQHYRLGRKLREVYDHLLPNKFDREVINVRSTDYDRTLMSAEYNLAGMFPVNSSGALIPAILWQGIPIHTVPLKMDQVLAMKAPCPNFDVEMKNLLNTDYFKEILEKFEPTFRYISNHTGKTINDITTAGYLYDNLYIEELYNYTLPEWTKEVYPETLRDISILSFRLDTFTESLARLSIGPLVNEITEHFLSVILGGKFYKMKLYSCHDTTIASLMNGLGLNFDDLPPYTSTLIFEIHADGHSSPSVRILYEFEEMEIPNCGTMCPIYQWITNYRNLIPQNHTYDCMRSNSFENPNVLLVYIIYLLTAIALISILGNAIMFFKRNKSKEILKQDIY